MLSAVTPTEEFKLSKDSDFLQGYAFFALTEPSDVKLVQSERLERFNYFKNTIEAELKKDLTSFQRGRCHAFLGNLFNYNLVTYKAVILKEQGVFLDAQQKALLNLITFHHLETIAHLQKVEPAHPKYRVSVLLMKNTKKLLREILGEFDVSYTVLLNEELKSRLVKIIGDETVKEVVGPKKSQSSKKAVFTPLVVAGAAIGLVSTGGLFGFAAGAVAAGVGGRAVEKMRDYCCGTRNR